MALCFVRVDEMISMLSLQAVKAVIGQNAKSWL